MDSTSTRVGEDQRRCPSGEDRISGLPDEMLHKILVSLGCAHAAARTSVLSRRWRHVWAHLPELRLVTPPEAAPASSMETVDAALGGYLAPTLDHLGVSITTKQLWGDLGIPAGRIAPWLQFAAEHVVGELNLNLCLPQWCYSSPPESGVIGVLELPACARAKRIELHLQYVYAACRLRPPASGEFTALTSLKISGSVRMEGSDLSALVCMLCPCLRDLNLCIMLIAIFDVAIHSNSLHALVLCVLETRRLEVVAPKLEEITVTVQPIEAHICAPKLVKVAWRGAYNPHLHRFVGVGRTLRVLKTLHRASSLTKRFDEVDELDMNIDLSNPVMTSEARYGSFLSETNNLPKCKSFCVFLSWSWGDLALVPVMLHLLRNHNGTKKFRVHLCGPSPQPVMHSCVPSRPCRFEESRKTDGIDLSSLEVVEIRGFSGSHEQMEFVEILFSNARVLKRLLINDEYCWRPKEVREKVRSLCRPNVKVEFCVRGGR